MADYIPFEIQTEIIKSLPIKSLIRFRSVSKPWKSLIDSSEFNVDYHVRHTQPQQHLLVRYTPDSNQYKEEFFSLVDDDKFHLYIPMFVNRLDKIIGNYQGLICFHRFGRYLDESGTVVLWNPSIRKSVVIDVPNVLDIKYETVVGFGVCHKTIDPKLVKISFTSNRVFSIPWQVEVFTLSSRTWRSISTNLPRKSIALRYNGLVVIDGVMYWLAFDRTNEFRFNKRVISFDLASEVFTEICFPPHLQLQSQSWFIYKPTKSLAVVECLSMINNYDIWIMEHGVQKSFTKLFSVKLPNNLVYRWVREFRKNGEVIMQTTNHYFC